MIQFILNQKEITSGLPPASLLLDFIRYQQNLTGTKIGCREGDCGACTVLVGEIINNELVYRSVTSCLMPLGNAHGKHIVTIEGINVEGLNFIQQAFAEEGATQCGFCTPGFIVSLAGFCLREEAAANQSAVDAVNGNICRCTGYKSIERAAATIACKVAERKGETAINFAIANNILPAYFSEIKHRLLAHHSRSNGVLTTSAENKKFVGGGTDLYVQQHDTIVHEAIELLFDQNQLSGITQEGNNCVMGAAVTVSDIRSSLIFQQYFPDLYQHIKLVSSVQIRNMATIAGNFVNASPIGDFTIFFLALDAQLVLSDGSTKREIALRKLYRGYKNIDKKPEEFIEKIYFQLPGKGSRFNFEKVSKRTNLDIASVNTAIHLVMDGMLIESAGLAAGGVGPVPAFLNASSAFLSGKEISTEVVNELIGLVQTEVSPISDARGTAAYKRFLLAQLIKAHFITLFPAMEMPSLMTV